jgi:hypothetical protein
MIAYCLLKGLSVLECTSDPALVQIRVLRMVRRVFFDVSSCLLWIVDSFFFFYNFLPAGYGKKEPRMSAKSAYCQS